MKAKGILCRNCSKVHWSGEWPAECIEARYGESKRSGLPMPYIRTDGMDALLNHVDGQLYDSRSAYERAIKDAGCEIIGDAALPSGVPEIRIDEKEIARDVKTAIDQLEAGYVGN
jgi:hypothetical protein